MPNTLQAHASHPHAPDKCASEWPTAWEGLRAVLPIEVWSSLQDLIGEDDPCTADGEAALEATARVLARQRQGHVMFSGTQ